MVEKGWRPPVRHQGAIAAVLGCTVTDLWPEPDEKAAE
jgi:hypothetical protein